MRRTLALFFVFGWLVVRSAHAGGDEPLGTYEQQALDIALTRTGLTVDPAPEGKRVRRIHVVNLEVFNKHNGFLQWLNMFHRTTRPEVIAREVLLRPGQQWNAETVADSRRRLDDSLFSNLVVIVPTVVSAQELDLLVVTRDIWSLRLNSEYEIQQGSLTQLHLALAENNFLGWRKHIALAFQMNQGAYWLGPQYVDKNLLGTRLRMVGTGAVIFARDSRELEGSRSNSSFSYPLWSLQRQWSAGLNLSHYSSVWREFLGTELERYEPSEADKAAAGVMGTCAVPWKYDLRVLNLETSVTRQIPGRVLHRFTLGHELSQVRRELSDDFPSEFPNIDTPGFCRDSFIANVLPRSERSSAPFIRYSFFVPRYITYRNVDAYDLPEERTLGPEASVKVAVARPELGSEAEFVQLATSAGWTFDWNGDGYFYLGASASGKLQDDELIDNRLTGTVKVVAPRFHRAVRLVGGLSADFRLNETNNTRVTLGGDNGLRGFSINEFRGQRKVRGNLELRTVPTAIWFSRAGGLIFWDVGHAAETFDDLAIQHDLGIGIRTIVPQLQPWVFRFDWAVPLTGDHAGLPGRFTAGARQVF